MDSQTSGVGTLLTWVLGDVSLFGRFAAFFGVTLLLWGIASPRPETILAGVALLFLALSNGHWVSRHVVLSYFGETRRWYQEYIWGRVFLPVSFFALFALFGWFWFRLPTVSAFLKAAGVTQLR